MTRRFDTCASFYFEQFVNIMVFTEDLWFLSGMTTVLLQKT